MADALLPHPSYPDPRSSAWLLPIWTLLIACTVLVYQDSCKAAVEWGFSSADFYTVEIPVASSPSIEAQQQAIHDALNIMMARVSGSSGDQWAQQQAEVSRSWMSHVGLGWSAIGTRIMRIDYSPETIRLIARENHLPILGAMRPKTLIWVMIDQYGDRILIDPESIASNPEFIRTFRALANELKLHLLWPETIFSPKLKEIWQLDMEAINYAAMVYGAQEVVVLRLWLSNEQWLSDWSLFHANHKMDSWDSGPGALDQTLRNGMIGLIDAQTGIFGNQSIVGSEPDTTLLSITGIYDIENLGWLLSYIHHIDIIEKTRIVSADSKGCIIIEVVHQHRASRLQDLLTLDQRLRTRQEPAIWCEGKFGEDLLRLTFQSHPIAPPLPQKPAQANQAPD